jgi:hypothetical protein
MMTVCSFDPVAQQDAIQKLKVGILGRLAQLRGPREVDVDQALHFDDQSACAWWGLEPTTDDMEQKQMGAAVRQLNAVGEVMLVTQKGRLYRVVPQRV